MHTHPNMSDTEAAIVARLVADILAAGHVISIWEGGGWATKKSSDREAIWAALASTGEDTLTIRDASGARVGSVLLIYGNEADIISDHTDTPEIAALIAGASKLADTLDA